MTNPTAKPIDIHLGPTKITLSKDEHGLFLHGIETDPSERGKGHGSRALKRLTQAADRLQLPIQLTPEPFGDTPNTINLPEWYGRHGFEEVESEDYSRNPDLIRWPSNPVTKLSRNGTTYLPYSLLFMSPSTRENSQAAYLNHPNMQKLKQVLTQMGHPHQLGIGHWADGMEESVVAKIPSEQVAKSAAWLGNAFNQKAVLYFTPGHGADKLHKVTGTSAEQLLSRGVEHSTVLPDGTGYVVDPKGELADKLAGLPHTTTTGTANFLGGDTREEAAEAYRHVLGS